jgi:hypothetical protein
MDPIALLSQVISFSPDAGLRKEGAVVVEARGAVVVTVEAAVVLVADSAVFPQATRPTRRGRSKSAFFTLEVCQEFPH